MRFVTLRGRLHAGSLVGVAAAVSLVVVLFATGAAGIPRTTAAGSRRFGGLVVGAGVRFPVGARLALIPYASVQRSALRLPGARLTGLDASFEVAIVPEHKRGAGRVPVVRARRITSGLGASLVAPSGGSGTLARIVFREIILSGSQTARLRRAAAQGRVAITARVRYTLRFTVRGRTFVRSAARSSSQTFNLKTTNTHAMQSAENRLTGLLVFDGQAGKFAGPITFAGNHVDAGSIYFTGAKDKWYAYGGGGPKGHVSLNVGPASAPALQVTEGYDEVSSSTAQRATCQVQSASGSGLSPTCATNRISNAPMCRYAPVYNLTYPAGTCMTMSVDTYFVSAPGVCAISGVTCSSPPATPETTSSFDGLWESYSVPGIFVYDNLAQKFAGPVTAVSHDDSTGHLYVFPGEDLDKWYANKPEGAGAGLFWKLPSGWVQVAVGPLKIKAIYNEKDQSKPRVRCQLEAAFSFYKLPPSCSPYHEDTGLWVCPPSTKSTGHCVTDPYSNNRYFVSAPGICNVSGVTCSDTPWAYSAATSAVSRPAQRRARLGSRR